MKAGKLKTNCPHLINSLLYQRLIGEVGVRRCSHKTERNPDRLKGFHFHPITVVHEVHSYSPKLNRLRSYFLKKCRPVFTPSTFCHLDLLIEHSLIPIPCLLSNPSQPPRDAFSSQGLPSISPHLCLSLTHFSLSLSHLFAKLTNEEDKE